jgi:signal peptidase II
MSASTAAAALPHGVPAQAPRLTNRAYRWPSAWARLLIVLALGLTADLTTKYLAFEHVADEPVRVNRQALLDDPYLLPPAHEGLHVLPLNLLDLRLVWNRGAVFGIGANRRIFFIAFTVAALAAGLVVFGRFTTRSQHLAHVALGLILAGGLGNLYDRITYGVVRDFLHMFPGWHLPFGWHYPQFLGGGNEIFPWVFNVADAMLLTGMGLLMLHINRLERHREKSADHSAAKPLQSEISGTPPRTDSR